MSDQPDAGLDSLLPCPFCGGPVKLESAGERHHRIEGRREFWGVVCRNTTNVGGSCCMQQVPSASKKAAIDRWNMRNGVRKERHAELVPKAESSGAAWICLLCKSGTPGRHGFLDDRVTPCPNTEPKLRMASGKRADT
jgi:hypothetical protein